MSSINTPRGYVLGANSIRQEIIRGNIIVPETNLTLNELGMFNDPTLEALVQSGSLDIRVGDEAFELIGDHAKLFTPTISNTVRQEFLREFPGMSKKKIRLDKNSVLQRNRQYLIPVVEKLRLPFDTKAKGTQGSNFGRIFYDSRVLADYHNQSDEISGHNNTPIRLWLLASPIKFDIGMAEGTICTQLRFFRGLDAKLTDREIRELFKSSPLLYNFESDKTLTPATPSFATTGGLEVQLDLEGKTTHGICGLKAISNSDPIDVSKRGHYNPAEYFVPMTAKDLEKLQPGDCYLLATKQIIKLPFNLNADLSRYHTALQAELHYAENISPGFEGSIVLEVKSNEQKPMHLRDGMVVSTINVYKTDAEEDTPSAKTYNGLFQGQTGPKVPKFFRPYDFEFGAKIHPKLQREVLVCDAYDIREFLNTTEEFKFIDEDEFLRLEKLIHKTGFAETRYNCEWDHELLQPIPYTILFGPNNTVFAYRRAADITIYGERDLFDKISIGLGAHIAPNYRWNPILNSATDSVVKEIDCRELICGMRPIGTIQTTRKRVDSVHQGIVFAAYTEGEVAVNDPGLQDGRLYSIDEFCKSISQKNPEEIETWTQLLIPHLHRIYRTVTN